MYSDRIVFMKKKHLLFFIIIILSFTLSACTNEKNSQPVVITSDESDLELEKMGAEPSPMVTSAVSGDAELFESELLSFSVPKGSKVVEDTVMGAISGYVISSSDYEKSGYQANIMIISAAKKYKERDDIPKSDDLSEFIALEYSVMQNGSAKSVEVIEKNGRDYVCAVGYGNNCVYKATNDAYLVIVGDQKIVDSILRSLKVSDYFVDNYSL